MRPSALGRPLSQPSPHSLWVGSQIGLSLQSPANQFNDHLIPPVMGAGMPGSEVRSVANAREA